MTAAKRAYGGVPAEERRSERRRLLLGAALDLIGEGGTASLTVHRLCRTAGLNERYFYESFESLDAVVAAVADDVGSRMVAEILTRLAAASPDARSQATAAVSAAVDLIGDDPRVAALLLESGRHPVIAERRIQLEQGIVGLMLDAALTTLKLDRTPEVESWATFASVMLLGGMTETFSAWTRGQLALTREELVDRCVEFFLAIGDHTPKVV